MGGSSSWGSLSAHVVEDLCTGDAGCSHGDLLSSLSLRDISRCLDEELWESLSWAYGTPLKVGSACGMRTSCPGNLWL